MYASIMILLGQVEDRRAIAGKQSIHSGGEILFNFPFDAARIKGGIYSNRHAHACINEPICMHV